MLYFFFTYVEFNLGINDFNSFVTKNIIQNEIDTDKLFIIFGFLIIDIIISIYENCPAFDLNKIK